MASKNGPIVFVLAVTALAIAASGAAAPIDHDFLNAVKQSNSAAVRAALKKGVDVNAPAGDASTALHWAADRDDVEIARLLIAAGARVNAANRWGVTPLSIACSRRSAPIAELLLRAGADANATQVTGESALMTASRTGAAAVVTLLLSSGADVNHRMPEHEQTALMWAASEKHPEVIRALIGGGADINAKSKTAYTPLMFAARSGDPEATRLLVDAGADVNAAAMDGFTPLLLATVRGHVGPATFLLEHGADPNAAGPGYTALHWSAGSWWTRLTGLGGIQAESHPEWRALAGLPEDKVEFVKALLAHGADPNAHIKKAPQTVGGFAGGASPPPMVGATPFWLAAYAADVDVMRELASRGADPKLGTDSGITPLMAAAGVGRVLGVAPITDERALDVVTLTLSLGNDINATTKAGDTALHGAAATRSIAVAQFLLKQGANLNAVNQNGQTPTDAAELTKQGGGGFIKQRSDLGDLLRSLGGIEQASESVTIKRRK